MRHDHDDLVRPRGDRPEELADLEGDLGARPRTGSLAVSEADAVEERFVGPVGPELQGGRRHFEGKLESRGEAEGRWLTRPRDRETADPPGAAQLVVEPDCGGPHDRAQKKDGTEKDAGSHEVGARR